MAYFAELDDNNVVLRVLSVDDLYESDGHNYLANTLNLGGTWVKTSYNTYGGEHKLGGIPFRKNYAGIGFTYDLNRDAFIPPKPFESWILNEDTCNWESPVPMPNDNKKYDWDEATISWVEVTSR